MKELNEAEEEFSASLDLFNREEKRNVLKISSPIPNREP
jgi:hypothetical protein